MDQADTGENGRATRLTSAEKKELAELAAATYSCAPDQGPPNLPGKPWV
jgi:hypothetical protein